MYEGGTNIVSNGYLTNMAATYLAFDAEFSHLRAAILAAVGNIFLIGLAVIALLALFRRRIMVVVEVIVLGILVALVIYDPAVIKGFADTLASILGAPGPIEASPGPPLHGHGG
jgi:hypothetical protein